MWCGWYKGARRLQSCRGGAAIAIVAGASKKIYGCSRFWQDLRSLLKQMPHIVTTFIGRRIDRTFASMVMLAVTVVNGCRYCIWFHSSMLLRSNISRDELSRILSLQFGEGVNDYALTALSFAVHYAQSDRHPDAEMTQMLFSYYGNARARDILLLLEVVYFANLVGNTFDAFTGRGRGDRCPGSTFLCELMISLLSAPILLPLMIMFQRKKKVSNPAF